MLETVIYHLGDEVDDEGRVNHMLEHVTIYPVPTRRLVCRGDLKGMYNIVLRPPADADVRREGECVQQSRERRATRIVPRKEG